MGGTHIASYLPENVAELLLFLTFLVSVARLWLWKHKGKLVRGDQRNGQTCEETCFWAGGARVPKTVLGGSRSWAQGKCSSFWSENHLGPSNPSLHTSPARTPQPEEVYELCGQAYSPTGPLLPSPPTRALSADRSEPDHPSQTGCSRTKGAKSF